MYRSYLLACAIAIAAAVWLASPYIPGLRGNVPDGVETAAPDATAEPLRVRVRHSVAQERIRRLVLAGQTEPSRQALVRAETAARVVAVEAAEGAVVQEGDVILRLAMDDREAVLAEARALLAHRRIEFEAANKLSSKGYQTQTRLAETRANLEAAEAQLRRARVDIERTVIRAPFDGVLQERAVEVGDYLGVGDPVALIIDLDPLIAVAQLSEREFAGIRRDTPGTARLITGDTAEGRVRYVSSLGSEGTRTFRVELELDNSGGRLAAGLTTEISIAVSTVKAHVLSPAVLTLNDAGEIGIKSVGDGNLVQFYSVELVSDDAAGVAVAGLPDELAIITVGQEFVETGQEVLPVPEPEAISPAAAADGSDS